MLAVIVKVFYGESSDVTAFNLYLTQGGRVAGGESPMFGNIFFLIGDPGKIVVDRNASQIAVYIHPASRKAKVEGLCQSDST